MCWTKMRTSLTLWCLMALAGAFATCYPELLALDVSRAMHGEWWRFVSGHFTHLSWRHFLVDEVALGMAIFICSVAKQSLGKIVAVMVFSIVAVSYMLVVFRPVDVYGGVSGVTCGLVVFAAMVMAAEGSRTYGCLMFIAVLIKILSEWLGFSVSDIPAVWQAHCAGAAAGGLLFVIIKMINRSGGS